MIGKTTLLQIDSIWIYAIDSIAMMISLSYNGYKKWVMIFVIVPDQYETNYVSLWSTSFSLILIGQLGIATTNPFVIDILYDILYKKINLEKNVEMLVY